MSQNESAEKSGVLKVTIVNRKLNGQIPSLASMYDISRLLRTKIEEPSTFELLEEE
ncbi:hypothetical protein A5819_001829 [Enterococcus sp. 7E2_DIV0204]|uniref:hypothetical protein n=1 Tax=unclassified Enterococcus TaxID=2608891 RepID=UPI000B693266|nr:MULTISPECIES: hypothetical protein [unclassified Enterococcus]OTN89337.1 hypothetical protein A5819_001829 [Enterococcus sp. 7E2_DIV0204]OTP51790.1 hypothetical protein A5884_000985 [Enterococcus sp. 7D2_DIV0200]